MSGGFSVARHPDARAFLRRGGPWLLRAEAEHNLILGVADRLALGHPSGFQPPLYLATVEEGGAVVGCAFRTPPFPLGVTRMPREALPALAADVAGVYDALPGVLGPDATAAAFGDLWTGRAGGSPRLEMRQTIYSLDTLTPPDPWPPGGLRAATAEDVDLAVAWMAAFHEEVAIPRGDPRARVDALVTAGDLFFWEAEGEPRATAAVVARTPHGARMGFVYTPRELRGRGYGAAVSAAVTRRVLEQGARFCFLYADRANPTSNAIYRRLGYRPVCDVSDYRFPTRDAS